MAPGAEPEPVLIYTVPLTGAGRTARRAAAGEALRRVLADQLGAEPAAVELFRDEHGKPRLAGGGPHFNLSHSGQLALIAVSAAGPVGVDVERLRELRDPARLARRVCTPAELEAVGRPPSSELLLALWVRKEAVAKAGGAGLGQLLDRIEVLAEVVDGHRLHDLVPAAGYVAAVAVSPGAGAIDVRPFDPRLPDNQPPCCRPS